MSAAACTFESAFVPVALRLEAGRSLRLQGRLGAEPELQEVPVLSHLDGSEGSSRAREVRAFQVHGNGLLSHGLKDGDYLLTRTSKKPRPGLAVVEIGGRPVLQLLSGDSRTPIIGGFLGIIRKRTLGPRRTEIVATERRYPDGFQLLTDTPPTRLAMLRSRLGMLESTCASTRNPRLRRALRSEAATIRQQLQNEAAHDKLA
jgi:hypothetical protein